MANFKGITAPPNAAAPEVGSRATPKAGPVVGRSVTGSVEEDGQEIAGVADA